MKKEFKKLKWPTMKKNVKSADATGMKVPMYSYVP